MSVCPSLSCSFLSLYLFFYLFICLPVCRVVSNFLIYVCQFPSTYRSLYLPALVCVSVPVCYCQACHEFQRHLNLGHILGFTTPKLYSHICLLITPSNDSTLPLFFSFTPKPPFTSGFAEFILPFVFSCSHFVRTFRC